MAEEKFKCEGCGKEVASDGKKISDCCGKPIVPMDLCLTATVAEHARFGDTDDACDDGRAG